jgi:hypothetical protein
MSKGESRSWGDLSLNIETTLTDPGPVGCAASRISAQNYLPHAVQAQASFIWLAVLPAPLAPSKQKTSPGSIFRSSESSATVPL